VLQRKQEIQISNELSQITKLAPVFNRLKQKFLQKLRMSKMNKTKIQILKTPLFKKPLLQEEAGKGAQKKTFVRMIASFNEHGQVRKSTVSQTMVDSKLEEERIKKDLSMISLKVPTIFERKKNPNGLCKFSCVFNANSKYQEKIEKDLIKFAQNKNENSNILEMGSQCKSMEQFDGKIKQKLAYLLNKKPDFYKNTKKLSGFKGPKHLKTLSDTYNELKTSNMLKNMKSYGEDSFKSPEINDESYVSFTEMKLISLYKDSKKMKKEMEINEKNEEFDRVTRDFQRSRLQEEMKRKAIEILGFVKRKIA